MDVLNICIQISISGTHLKKIVKTVDLFTTLDEVRKDNVYT